MRINSLKTKKFAFVFPGQGSQILGMGQELAETFPAAKEVYAAADELLGYSISKLSWLGPEDQLNDTEYTQPALLVHSVAALSVLRKFISDIKPQFIAGHSMGQLSALFASNSLNFKNCLELVCLRGKVMKKAGEINPGSMAAVLGLNISTLERICKQASTSSEIVQVANDNCPGQVVISGASLALERAIQLAKEAKARRVIPLAVSIAAHSPLMKPAQLDFNRAVQSSSLSDPIFPIVGNVSATPLFSSDEVREDLQAQLTSRVRWAESIQFMIAQGVTHFIEIGSGNVLSGLIKRIDRSAITLSLTSPDNFNILETWA